jgi:hypothetical protein
VPFCCWGLFLPVARGLFLPVAGDRSFLMLRIVPS